MLLYNVILFDLFSIEGELIEQQSHLINRKATIFFVKLRKLKTLKFWSIFSQTALRKRIRSFSFTAPPSPPRKLSILSKMSCNSFFFNFQPSLLFFYYPIPGRLQLFETREVLLSSSLFTWELLLLSKHLSSDIVKISLEKSFSNLEEGNWTKRLHLGTSWMGLAKHWEPNTIGKILVCPS